MKIKVINYVLKLLCCLILLSAGPVSAQDDGGDAADKLTALLSRTQTMSAQVIQLTLDQQGREVQEYHASLQLSKPDHFRFHATRPYERLMVTDGEKLWNYEPDLEQVTIDSFNSDYSSTPGMLLSADADTLRELFNITLSAGTDGDTGLFILYPLQTDALFERLSLTFTQDILTELQFEDSLGQKTSMTFTDIVENPELPADTFTFVIPNDVDVIDSTVD